MLILKFKDEVSRNKIKNNTAVCFGPTDVDRYVSLGYYVQILNLIANGQYV